MLNRIVAITLCISGLWGSLEAAISVTSGSADWTPIVYPGVTSDYPKDEQATSPESDLVGNDQHAAVFLKFDDGGTSRTENNRDGELAFRVRLAGEKQPAGFSAVVWFGLAIAGVGDVGGTDVDAYLRFNSASSRVSVHATGSSANTSPSTTSISSTPEWAPSSGTSRFGFAPVNSIDTGLTGVDTDLDDALKPNGSGVDYYLTVVFPFAEVAAAIDSLMAKRGYTTFSGFTDETAFGLVVATATQSNSLNQDLNGVKGDVRSVITWDQLDAISPIMDSTGSLVAMPEPKTAILTAALAAMTGVLWFRRRTR